MDYFSIAQKVDEATLKTVVRSSEKFKEELYFLKLSHSEWNRIKRLSKRAMVRSQSLFTNQPNTDEEADLYPYKIIEACWSNEAGEKVINTKEKFKEMQSWDVDLIADLSDICSEVNGLLISKTKTDAEKKKN